LTIVFACETVLSGRSLWRPDVGDEQICGHIGGAQTVGTLPADAPGSASLPLAGN